MADIQRQFKQFHKTIKLDRFKENAELREKRDRVLTRLKENLDKLFTDRDEAPPEFTTFNQGSYAMGTGIQPIDDDFDIDVGVRFKIATDDYPDPVEVKEWVYNALENHTQHVDVRRSCVTVYYSHNDEPIYHVDLAIYSDENADGHMYLAKGKIHSSDEYRFWEKSNPQKLMDLVKEQFDGDDAKQFRRVIRYLKRWRSLKFSSDGNAAPIGIGITVAAYHWFSPQYDIVDPFSNNRQYNDLEALRCFSDALLNRFRTVYSDGEPVERLVVELPVEPFNDLFEKMTDNQMIGFKSKIETLQSALVSADEEADPVTACKILVKQFGDDFPVPPKEETARKVAPSIISSSSSA